MKINLISPDGKRNKSFKYGVSWCYLIFGGWYSLFKKQWTIIGIEIILNVLIAAGVGLPLTVIYHVLLWLCGNKMYAKYLVRNGWEPAGEADRKLLGTSGVD